MQNLWKVYRLLCHRGYHIILNSVIIVAFEVDFNEMIDKNSSVVIETEFFTLQSHRDNLEKLNIPWDPHLIPQTFSQMSNILPQQSIVKRTINQHAIFRFLNHPIFLGNRTWILNFNKMWDRQKSLLKNNIYVCRRQAINKKYSRIFFLVVLTNSRSVWSLW